MKKLLSILALTLATATSFAWEPPTDRMVTATIGFAPGSGNELSFRGFSAIVQRNNPRYHFTVQNQPGADGVVAMNSFIDKPSDGQHVYVASHQGIWVTADYFNKPAVKYTLTDFEYGLTLAKSPLVIIAASNSKTSTPKQLIERLKTTKDPVTFAAGSGAHKLAYEFLMESIKGDRKLITTIGYRGPQQAANDVAGGHVEFGIVPVAVANTLLQSGKIKLIGLCSEQKLAGIPDAPLMKDYVPGLNVYAAWGLVFPKYTHKEIVSWYVSEYSKAIKSPEGKQFMLDNLMFNDGKELTPTGFEKSMMSLRKQWIPIIEKMDT